MTYFETRDVFGARIVNETSSHPGVGADPVPLDEDHLSIAKPRKPDAQVCGAARDLLRGHVRGSRRAGAVPSDLPAITTRLAGDEPPVPRPPQPISPTRTMDSSAPRAAGAAAGVAAAAKAAPAVCMQSPRLCLPG